MAVLDIESSIASTSSGAAETVRIQPAEAAAGCNTSLTVSVILIEPAEADVNCTGDVIGSVIRILSSAAATISNTTVTSSVIRMQYVSAAVSSLITENVDAKKYRTLSVDFAVQTRMKAYRTDRDIPTALRNYVPAFLQASPIFQKIQKAQGIELTRLFAVIEQMLLNNYVDTATPEALLLWEADLGIKTDLTKTLEQRRLVVKSKLKKSDITTKQRFEKMLEDNFYVCSAEERPAEYRVLTTILSKRGIPDDIADMVAAVDETLPAHLVHEFIYTWLPWDEAEQVSLTWDQAEDYTWDELETSFLVPFSGGEG